jgi:hypothetical protein
MKILVATKETQGLRKNDFSFTEDGELVMLPTFTCDSGSVDDDCGCLRSVVGVKTRKATTSYKVIEQNVTWQDVRNEMARSLYAAGFSGIFKDLEEAPEGSEPARSAAWNVGIAATLPVGTVLGIRDFYEFVRRIA